MKRWLCIVTVSAGLLLPAVAWAGGSSHRPQRKPMPSHVVVAPRPVVRPAPVVVLKPGRQIDPGYNQLPLVKPITIHPWTRPYPPPQPIWYSSHLSKHYRTRVYQDHKGRSYYWCQPDSCYRSMDDCPYGRYDLGDPPAEDPNAADPGDGTMNPAP